MGKSTKPRKKYNPRPIQGMPIIYGMQEEIKAELAIAPLMAINMFMSGNGNEDLAYTIINSVLIGYWLVNNDVKKQIILKGSNAMKRVLARGEDGKWGFSGDDLKDIKEAITLSDELQALATRRQMQKAVHNVLHCAS
jgi:hypothetical protein